MFFSMLGGGISAGFIKQFLNCQRRYVVELTNKINPKDPIA